jgi:hypothetical protein
MTAMHGARHRGDLFSIALIRVLKTHGGDMT